MDVHSRDRMTKRLTAQKMLIEAELAIKRVSQCRTAGHCTESDQLTMA